MGGEEREGEGKGKERGGRGKGEEKVGREGVILVLLFLHFEPWLCTR